MDPPILRIRDSGVKKAPDPGSATLLLAGRYGTVGYLTVKEKCTVPSNLTAYKNRTYLTVPQVSVVDPDSDFLPVPDPGSRGQKGAGSRIRNNAPSTMQKRAVPYRFL